MSKNIVLVEDDPSVVPVLTELLSGTECESIHFANGSEAMSHLKKNVPDLLIVDLYLPGVNGLEIIESARKKKGKPKIIAYSGDETMGTIAKSTGADFFIHKPFEAEEMLQLINNCLDYS